MHYFVFCYKTRLSHSAMQIPVPFKCMQYKNDLKVESELLMCTMLIYTYIYSLLAFIYAYPCAFSPFQFKSGCLTLKWHLLVGAPQDLHSLPHNVATNLYETLSGEGIA